MVPKSRHSVLDRAVITHPAQTRRQLRRMAINPTTHGMHHLHDIALLERNVDNGGDVSAPALRGVCPTRDLIDVDLARRRERDEPFPLRAQGPQNLNRPLADVLVVFIQEITRGWDAFHPAGRNQRLHGCFLYSPILLLLRAH